jgi:MFS family permease
MVSRGSVGLVTSAVGGAVAGALADALGRVRVLILSIASYALFTLLAGCAQSYEQLLVFLTLQGLGFGGEWAAGAVLVAEYADATQRGRVVGSVQSAWSIGYAGVLLANTITFSLAPPELAWRIMFWLGALPAVALLWVRTGIEESPLYRAEVAARARGTGPAGAKPGAALLGLFRRDQLRVTLASALLSVGVIGAGLFIWLPTYLEQVRHLTVKGIAAYMGIQVIGGLVGCISAGYVLDALGRRRGLALFALGSGLSAWAYVVLPVGTPPGWCSPSAFRSASSAPASSAGSRSISPSSIRPSCAARARASATTSAVASARSGRPRSAWRRRASG